MESTSRMSSNLIIVRGKLIPYFSPLSKKDLRLVVSIQTNCTWIHHSHSMERSFFIFLRFFFLIEPRWFFIHGSEWRKPNLCIIWICTLGAPGIRPDARRVSKARLLSQTLAYPEVATCHIIAISQDCRSQCRTARSYVRAWYRTDQHVMIHLNQ